MDVIRFAELDKGAIHHVQEASSDWIDNVQAFRSVCAVVNAIVRDPGCKRYASEKGMKSVRTLQIMMAN